MFSPLRLFEMYIAMGLHFKEGSKYNFIKYDGKARSIKMSSLEKRKDRYFFEKIASKLHNEEEAILFLFTNFLNGKKYIRELSFDYMKEFRAYADSLDYKFNEDLTRFKEENPIDVCYMGLIDAYYYLILIDEASNGYIFKQYDIKYGEDDILWSDLKFKLNRVRPFVVKYMNITPKQKLVLRDIIKNHI